MELDVREDATADEVLRVYFAAHGERLRGRGRDRLREAERQLRRCLEGRLEHLLPPTERTILHAEREFAPRGAGARLAAPRLILHVLPVFVETWHGAELEERGMQLTVAGRLLELVHASPDDEELVELLAAAKVALRRARRRFQLAKLETRWQERVHRIGA